MSHLRKPFVILALLLLSAGPALAAPALSSHGPTLAAPTSSAPASIPWRGLLTLGGIVGTAITVKDTASTAQKFVQRAAAAAPDYQKGVANAGPKWQANAASAEPNYVAGVQAAATRGAYGKGIAKHGSTKYQTNATNLGVQRYPTGVQNAQSAYQSGVDPYLQILKGLDLPSRGPKGAPQNMNRSALVAQALRKAKVGA
jgi:hypothetical protein